MQELQAEVESAYCAENSTSEESARIKFEKYKAFAMKKKLEISRELRSKSLIAAAGASTDINIDLGVFGNIPLASLLDDTFINTSDLGAEIGAGIVNAINRNLDPIEAKNPLVIHFTDLKEGITQRVKIFKSKQVKKDLEKFKIKGTDFKLDPEREATLLSQVPGLIEELITNSDNFKEAAKRSGKTPQQILEEKRKTLVSQWGESGTLVSIQFSATDEPKITKIMVNSPDPDILSVHIYGGASKPLPGPLSNKRTVNYLKNLTNLIPLQPDNFRQAFEQLVGLGSSPCSDSSSQITPGSGLIMRYTVDNDGKSLSFEKEESSYSPLHDWKNDLAEREEAKRISELFENDWTKEVSWGVDEVLPELGPTCDSTDIFRFIRKTNLSKLLCNFVACAPIPAVNVKLPNLTLPEIPEIPIFEYPGLDFDELLEQLDALALRLICGFIRNLLDILNSPFN